MNIPARLIRAVVQDIPGLRPVLSPRQQRTRELTLKAATATFAHLGRRGVSMRALSAGIWISRERIQTHFLDVDSILAEILHLHLEGLARALGNVSHDPKDRRAAYFAYTRGVFGSVKMEHALLIYERQYLPEDLLPAIDQIHREFGPGLCPENPDLALRLLDDQALGLEDIEAALTGNGANLQPEHDLALATDAELAAQCLEHECPADENPQLDGAAADPGQAPTPAPIRPLASADTLAGSRNAFAALLRHFPDLPGSAADDGRAAPEAA